MPVCSMVLAGAVVGAPGADNLKIRPELYPVIVKYPDFRIIVRQTFYGDFAK
ncbi:hypothetical protein [Photobacterium salinisoli]|uniref:hypothetical protein n=1 Tax=Photobacterium salinisoli TaxID=1616783 RepID=UPI0013C4171C|nr:hypothetical protein [Photobacterium salinisoli]